MISVILAKYPDYALLYTTKEIKTKNANKSPKDILCNSIVSIKKSFVEHLEKSKHIKQLKNITITGSTHNCGEFTICQGTVNVGTVMRGHTVIILNKFSQYSSEIKQDLLLEFLFNELNHINSVVKMNNALKTNDTGEELLGIKFEIEDNDIRRAILSSHYKILFQSVRGQKNSQENKNIQDTSHKVLNKLDSMKYVIFEIIDMCIGMKLFH